MQTLDDSRDDTRPDELRGERTDETPARSPWEPPRGDTDGAAPTGPPDPSPDADIPDARGPSPDDDVFARLNVMPGEDGDAVEPPFVVEERDLGVSEEPRAPSKAATVVAFGVVVMAVLGILMTVASVKLFLERSKMSQALEASADHLAMVYAGPQATDTSKRRIAWLQKSLNEGDFGQAQKAIQSLGAPEVDGQSPLDLPGVDSSADGSDEDGGDTAQRRLPSPDQDENLPIAAQAFFEQHPKLWEAFFGFSVAIRKMQQEDMPVESFAKLRSQMVDAAAAGDAARVEELLNQAREQVGAQSPGQLPQNLQAKLQQFGQAIQKAREERRDVRAALALAQKSERAAQRGNLKRAEKLMDQALTALKDAPRVQMPRRPGGMPPGARAQERMPQMGPEIGLLRFVADLAAKVMHAEDRDLTEVWEAINIAAGAIREKNADQVREILGEAKDALHEIGDRRREMTAAIQRAQEKVRQTRPPRDGESAGPSEEQQRERQEIILDRVAEVLARVRSMPEEEFEANRAEIAQAVVKAMTAPVQTPGEDPGQPDLSPEERVREKMRIAGEMYRQLTEKTDADTTELDEKFAEVRELLTEHEYERAEELVDEGVTMMRRMAEGMEPTEAPEDDTGYGSQLQLDRPGPSLDLRPDVGEPRIPGAPGDIGAPENTSEGVEQ